MSRRTTSASKFPIILSSVTAWISPSVIGTCRLWASCMKRFTKRPAKKSIHRRRARDTRDARNVDLGNAGNDLFLLVVQGSDRLFERYRTDRAWNNSGRPLQETERAISKAG